jgi:hypothetical protein
MIPKSGHRFSATIMRKNVVRILEKGRGSGAPRGANSLGPRNTGKRCRSSMPRARRRAADKWTQSAQLICLRGALAFRRSTCGSRRDFHILAQLQARLPGTRVRRALPAFACPSPGKAPPAPAVVPGEHDARNRPGAECESARRRRPCSAFESALAKAPADEQGDCT